MFLLFLQAYSLGGGTYTGIEAVSNGMPIMREPRVATARRTMAYMAISLSITAAGLVVCYLLWSVKPVAGRTLNAVLAESIARDLSLTHAFVVVTLVAEGALLVVAAQTGFIAGPRALANMAIDSWMPRRFSALSERLTTQNGIVLMGAAALAALMYTHGNVREIVIMYSINVFLTFSMSMLGMSRWLLRQRRKGQEWRGQFTLFAFGFIFCMTILGITVFEKFTEGGWMTLVVTGLIVLMCFFVRRHYRATSARLASLFTNLSGIPRTGHGPVKAIDPTQAAAAILVGGYSGLGIHTTLSAFKTFPGQFKSAVFLSVGVIDSRAFKTDDAPDRLRAQTEANLKRYVELMQAQGVPATFRMGIGTDVVSELEELCLAVARDFPRVTFFAGQLIFRNESWFQRILHNETAFALQKRLQLGGHTMVILPVRVE
jgi:hypothetical protein